MAITRTISYGCSSLGLSDTVTCTGAATELEETIAPAASNVVVNVALDVSVMTGIYMVASGAMTIKTNSSGSPDDTITLVANQPYVWTSVCLMTNLLTVDVTKLYVSSTPGGTLKIVVTQDATP